MPISVKISHDNMEALVEVEREASAPTLEAIRRALTEAGVSHGIDEEAIRELLLAAGQVPPGGKLSRRVASATPPVDGEDGKLLMAVDYGRSTVGILTKAGMIDFHDRGSFTPVEEGQLLATIAPPTSGTPGRDVRGTALQPQAGKPIKVSAGNGAKVMPCGTEIRAERSGDLRRTGDLIEVLDIIKVQGDLDYDVGSIECEGPVRVEGDVLPGFHIHAGGDVWIGGVVESARIRSGGSVTVRQGILNHSRVVAKGSLKAGYLRDSHVEIGGAVTVDREAINSTVAAGEGIVVSGAGRVIGGSLFAKQGIQVGTAGHANGVATLLYAGVAPKKEAKDGTPQEEREPAATRVVQAEAAQPPCLVKVTQRVHPGVRVRIGAAELHVKAELRATTFHLDQDSGAIVKS